MGRGDDKEGHRGNSRAIKGERKRVDKEGKGMNK